MADYSAYVACMRGCGRKLSYWESASVCKDCRDKENIMAVNRDFAELIADVGIDKNTQIALSRIYRDIRKRLA